MAKGKKRSKGKTITLKMAKNALRVTPDGKRRLDLSNMGIDSFPKCLLKLTGIDELDLSRNKLMTIPDFISKFTSVCWLDLHSNNIKQLPPSIGQMESLCYLNLCNNHLDSTGLPADIGNLKNLQTLNLGLNQLTVLPPTMASLTNLRELGLFDNKLTTIPEFIQALPSLLRINTKRNPVVYAQREAKDIKSTKGLYLVKEADLCTSCAEKCQEDRLRMKKKMLSSQTQPGNRFLGLVTPNSVAQNNQELWR